MTIDRIVPPRGSDGSEKGLLLDRCALVTGGARRIGRSLVLAVARQGADVVLHFDKSRTEAEQTADQARQYGAVVHLIQGDLQDPRTAADLLPEAAELVGRPIDLLINNASVFAPGSAQDTTIEQWDMHHLDLRRARRTGLAHR